MKTEFTLEAKKINERVVKMDLYSEGKLIFTYLEQDTIDSSNILKHCIVDIYNKVLMSAIEDD